MASMREDQDDLDAVQLLVVQEVQKYPELFDKSHTMYKKCIYKIQLWGKIAKDLGISGRSTILKTSRSRSVHVFIYVSKL